MDTAITTQIRQQQLWGLFMTAVISMNSVVMGRYVLYSDASLPAHINLTAAGRTSPVRVVRE